MGLWKKQRVSPLLAGMLVVSTLPQPARSAESPSLLVVAPTPVRVTGQTSLTTTRQFSSTQPSSAQTEAITSLLGKGGARGYVWRPWFSQLSLEGQVGFDVTQSWAAEDAQTLGALVSGSANLSILPSSRFPFTAQLTRRDSYIDTDLDSTTTDSTSLTLTQSYRPLGYWPSYRARFNHRLTNHDNGGAGRDTRLSMTVEHQIPKHRMQARFEYERNQEDVAPSDNGLPGGREPGRQEEDVTYSLFGNHTYAADSGLSVASLASAVQQTQDRSVSELSTELWQFSSTAAMSVPERALTLNSNFRVAEIVTTSVTASDRTGNRTRNVGGGIGAQQNPSQALSLSGNLTFDYTDSADGEVFSTAESASLRYQPSSMTFGDYRYDWGTGANASLVQANENTEQLSSNFNQGVFRRIDSPEGRGQFQFRANQTMRKVLYDSRGGPLPLSLAHQLSWGWQAARDAYQDYLQLGLSDQRELGEGEGLASQLLNLQISRNSNSLAGGRWGANYTQQLAREEQSEGDRVTLSASGSLNFSRSQLFRIRGTSFVSSFGASYTKDLQLPERDADTTLGAALGLGADDEGDAEQTFFWNNELRYQLGRLRAELDTNLDWENDNYNGSIMLRITRVWDSM